jgi:hypothetical protein
MSAGRDGHRAGAGADWSAEHRFEVITTVPAVSSAISSCAAHAPTRMSAEEFLARATVGLPQGTAIRRGGARGRALALRWGLRTGKSQEAELPAPTGRVIASVLCSLAYHGQDAWTRHRSNTCRALILTGLAERRGHAFHR